MASKSSHLEEHAAKQKEPGVSWKQNEEHVIPKNRLSIVSFALVCTMFIAALDLVSQRVSCCRIGLMVGWGGGGGDFKTIVATALPTIVADLHGGSHYSWVGRHVFLSFQHSEDGHPWI